VAQFVFAEPGPGGQAILKTRLGCDANVRKVFASAAEGAVKVRSLLLTYTPSPTNSGPPIKDKVVFVETSELQPLPSVVVQVAEGKAAGSLLKISLVSDIVSVPVDPVSRVLMTLAEAFETKSKPPARTVARPQTNGNLRNAICNLQCSIKKRRTDSGQHNLRRAPDSSHDAQLATGRGQSISNSGRLSDRTCCGPPFPPH